MSTLYIGKYEDMTGIYQDLAQVIANVEGRFLNKSYEYYLSDEKVALDQQQTLIELVYK